jgi:hypothetical protein
MFDGLRSKFMVIISIWNYQKRVILETDLYIVSCQLEDISDYLHIVLVDDVEVLPHHYGPSRLPLVT